jgi:hypothetical protein
MAISYTQPEECTSLQIACKYTNKIIESGGNGSVIEIKWSPDERALAIIYERGNFSLFSVFGSLLFYSKDLL